MQNTPFSREKIAEGVYFSRAIDPKFYSNRIMVCLITRLSGETAADNAVVPAVLRMGCRTCPDLTALNRRLGLLYGASLDGGATGFGEYQILSVSVRGLDRRVALHGEDMAGELGELLCDVVLDPLVEDGAFSRTYTGIERTNLVEEIESEINDKRLWAQERCLELLFGDSPRAIRPCGAVESARAITPESAWAAYRRLIDTARIEILFTGSGDPSGALGIFRRRFADVRRSPAALETAPPVFPERFLEKTETMEVSQGKLVMSFSCNPQSDRELYALRMMAAMYGGTPFSKLFLNVRERLSLCYYCSARYDRGNRIVMVSSGVENDKRAAAHDEILRQLEALRAGDFTDEELRNTVLIMNTSFAATGDSLHALGGWYLTQILAGTMLSPAGEQARMASVTRDEVIAAARSIDLRAEYFLTSPDAGKGEGDAE